VLLSRWSSACGTFWRPADAHINSASAVAPCRAGLLVSVCWRDTVEMAPSARRQYVVRAQPPKPVWTCRAALPEPPDEPPSGPDGSSNRPCQDLLPRRVFAAFAPTEISPSAVQASNIDSERVDHIMPAGGGDVRFAIIISYMLLYAAGYRRPPKSEKTSSRYLPCTYHSSSSCSLCAQEISVHAPVSSMATFMIVLTDQSAIRP